MSGRLQVLGSIIADLRRLAGWRLLVLLAAMVTAAFSEGFGLLLLVPLLALVLPGTSTAGGQLQEMVASAADRFGLDLSLGIVLILFLAIVAMRQSMSFVTHRAVEQLRVRHVASLRSRLFAALGQADWRSVRDNRFASANRVLLTDCWRAGDAALQLLRLASVGLITIANIVIAWLLSPPLTLLVLVAGSVLVMMFGGRLRHIGQGGERVTRINEEIHVAVENFASNLRSAKVAGATDQLTAQFSDAADDLSKQMIEFQTRTMAAQAGLQIAAAVGIAGFVLLASRGYAIAGPELLLLVLIAARLVPYFSSLVQSAYVLAFLLPAFGRTHELIVECRAHAEHLDAGNSVPAPAREVAVKDLVLAAPDGRTLLGGVSLLLETGTTTTLFGPSGAGKSTLADVLAGLVTPDGGAVLVDGVALRPDQYGAWRRHVGYVPQDAALVRGSLRDNLTCLLPVSPSEEELRDALDCVAALDIVDATRDGLDTRIERRSGQLSGGERQRILIARELLRRPALLLLDEATSALDVDAEASLISRIRERYPAMTLLLIAHRPETASCGDLAIRLDRGRVDGLSGARALLREAGHA